MSFDWLTWRIALTAVAIVLVLAASAWMPTLIRKWPQEKQDQFYRSIERQNRIEKLVWRWFLWPLIFLGASYIAFDYWNNTR